MTFIAYSYSSPQLPTTPRVPVDEEWRCEFAAGLERKCLFLELFGSDSIPVPPSLFLNSAVEMFSSLIVGAKLMKNCFLYSDLKNS